jgi:hypothetical protein
LVPRSQTTILPATLAGSSVPRKHKAASLGAAPALATSPEYTTGPVRLSPNGTVTEAPAAWKPFGSVTVPSYVGMVDAATVVYHGDAWSAVAAPGPLLPALTATNTPAAAALKNEMSSGWSTVVAEPPPIE